MALREELDRYWYSDNNSVDSGKRAIIPADWWNGVLTYVDGNIVEIADTVYTGENQASNNLEEGDLYQTEDGTIKRVDSDAENYSKRNLQTHTIEVFAEDESVDATNGDGPIWYAPFDFTLERVQTFHNDASSLSSESCSAFIYVNESLRSSSLTINSGDNVTNHNSNLGSTSYSRGDRIRIDVVPSVTPYTDATGFWITLVYYDTE